MVRGDRLRSCLLAASLLVGCGRHAFEDHDGGVDAVDAAEHNTTVTFGDLGDDNPHVIARLANGNLLVGGQFRGVVNFGCPPLTSAGGADGFMVELTPSLTCARTWTIGGLSDDLVTDFSEDALRNLVVVGEFRQTATMASGPALTAAFTRDIFLTKLTPAWQEIWTRQLPGNSADETYDLIDHVRVASTGAIHVAGRVWGTVTFGWGGPTQAFTDNGWGDVFVLNVSSDGAYLGADTFGGGGSDHPFAAAVDDQDNFYLGGIYRGTVDFDPGPGTLQHSGNFDSYLQKRTPDGMTLVWANVQDNGAWRPYNGIAIKAGGQLAAVQADFFTLNPAIVLRTMSFNTSDGSIAWSRDVPAVSAYPTAVATDAEGNVYAGGRFADTVDFAPTSGGDMRTSTGLGDCYLQRYDADGTLRWTITFGGIDEDNIDGIAALGPDDIVVIGTFHGDVDFGWQTADVHSARGGSDIFVRRITR